MSSNEDKLKEIEEIHQRLVEEIHRPETDESDEVVKARLEVIRAQQKVADTANREQDAKYWENVNYQHAALMEQYRLYEEARKRDRQKRKGAQEQLQEIYSRLQPKKPKKPQRSAENRGRERLAREGMHRSLEDFCTDYAPEVRLTPLPKWERHGFPKKKDGSWDWKKAYIEPDWCRKIMRWLKRLGRKAQ